MKVIYLLISIFLRINKIYPQLIPQYALTPELYIAQTIPTEYSSNALYDPIYFSHQAFTSYPTIQSNSRNETNVQDKNVENDSVEVEANTILKRLEIPRPVTPLPSNNYRGFGYHNKYSNEGSSTVIFLTGPPMTNDISEKLRITVASDSLDPQIPHIEERLGNIFNQPSQSSNSPFLPILKTLIANSQNIPQVHHFYAESSPPSSIESDAIKAESKNVENKVSSEGIQDRSSTNSLEKDDNNKGNNTTLVATTTVASNENRTTSTTTEIFTTIPDEKSAGQEQTTKI